MALEMHSGLRGSPGWKRCHWPRGEQRAGGQGSTRLKGRGWATVKWGLCPCSVPDWQSYFTSLQDTIGIDGLENRLQCENSGFFQ